MRPSYSLLSALSTEKVVTNDDDVGDERSWIWSALGLVEVNL